MANTKVAFITGGNRGIGFETARELAEKGVHVVIGSRSAEQGKLAVQKLREKNLKADFLTFDTAQPGYFEVAAQYFEDKFGRLDILVNNAGVLLDAEDASQRKGNMTSTTSPEILRKTFDVNFFAVVELTQTLLPLLKKSEAGRIVNVSSILASLTLHSDPSSGVYNGKVFAYDASKTALNAFSVHLAHELKDTPIKVNSAHPGWVKTDMGGKSALMEVTDGGKTSVQLALLLEDGPTGGFFHMGEKLPW
jgi:NAD(P)-dependent dehydrogenase (short-subunit alcohol dehydrogenase family)